MAQWLGPRGPGFDSQMFTVWEGALKAPRQPCMRLVHRQTLRQTLYACGCVHPRSAVACDQEVRVLQRLSLCDCLALGLSTHSVQLIS